MISFFVSIATAILTFFVSAFALKLALKTLGQPARENKYGTAVTVAGLLSLSSLLLTFFPFFVGWFVYPVLWLLIVRSVYHISFSKSLALAVLQAVIHFGLMALIGMLF